MPIPSAFSGKQGPAQLRPGKSGAAPALKANQQSRSTEEGLTIKDLQDVELKVRKVTAPKSNVRQQELKEAKRRQDVTDSEYWVALCFESREQKEEFLRKLTARGVSTEGEDKYVDGRKFARMLGVAVTPDPAARRNVTISSRWQRHVKEMK
jgi:hypothetical protein